MRESAYIWFDHVCRKLEHVVVRRSKGVQTITKRNKERPKETWLETIRKVLKICNLIERLPLPLSGRNGEI